MTNNQSLALLLILLALAVFLPPMVVFLCGFGAGAITTYIAYKLIKKEDMLL